MFRIISLRKMAMPMRLMNVRHRIAIVIASRRPFLLIESRIHVNSFSHTANKGISDEGNENGEDFFGIPENFKLQHARHDTSTAQTLEKHSSGTNSPQQNVIHATSEQSATEFKNEEVQDDTQSRKRRSSQASFRTSFGFITLDNNRTNSSKMSTEDLANKAQEILSKLSSINVKRAPKVNDMQQDNKASFPKISGSDLSKSSYRSNGSAANSNYFDEVYFPEHSVGEDSSILLDNRPTNIIRVPESRPLCARLENESQYSQEHTTLPKTNIHAELRIARNTSVNSEQPSSNWLDQQYFGASLNDENKKSEKDYLHGTEGSPFANSRDSETHVETKQPNVKQIHQRVLNEQTLDFNEIDQVYFRSTFQNLSSNKDNIVNEMTTEAEHKGENSAPLKEIVTDYANHQNGNNINQELSQPTDTSQLKRGVGNMKKLKEASRKQQLIGTTDQPQLNRVPLSANFTDEQQNALQGKQILNDASKEQEPNSDILSSEHFLKTRNRTKTYVQPNLEKPETAYDLAMKIRDDIKRGNKIEEQSSDKTESVSQTTKDDNSTDSHIKLDSKGFRRLDDHGPDLDKMTSADIVRMLKTKIVFDHEDFLAIDKPYGLPCFSQKQERVSVTELLPAFAEHLPRSYKTSELHLVQGLDRDVTGAIILAKNPEVAYMLRGMYKNSDMVTQRFWAITKGIPNPSAGIIDIPIGEGKVDQIYKMVLRPRFLKDEKQIGSASKAASGKAVTQYKVLSSHLQSALVECTLLTNVKHQIRLHLASGLATPILGDHKYSSFSKLTPQKLHPEMLKLLKIRQASVRNLALHLHCRSIILKDYKGRMIFLTTYPPSHFRDNMRNLRIPKSNL